MTTSKRRLHKRFQVVIRTIHNRLMVEEQGTVLVRDLCVGHEGVHMASG